MVGVKSETLVSFSSGLRRVLDAVKIPQVSTAPVYTYAGTPSACRFVPIDACDPAHIVDAAFGISVVFAAIH